MELIENCEYLWLQICGSIIVSWVFVNLGALMGYPTKALPQLRNETNLAVNLDEYEGSVFAAVTFMTGKITRILGWLTSPIWMSVRAGLL